MKTITKRDELALLGLKTRATCANMEVEGIRRTVCELVGIDPENYEVGHGWVSDFVYDEKVSLNSFLTGLEQEEVITRS